MSARLTQKRVAELISKGLKGETRDGLTRGLVLRVRGPGKWSWTYRRLLGRVEHRRDLSDLWTLDEARALVDELNVIRKKRWAAVEICEPARFEDWIARKRAEKLGRTYVPPPEPEPELEPDGTLWRDAQGAWKIELARTRRGATAYTYDAGLRLPAFAKLRDRRISTVTRDEVAEVIAAIHAAGHERQAELCAIYAKSLFKFCSDDTRRAKYKVERGLLAGLKAPERTLVETDDDESGAHVPDGPEIGRIARWLRDAESEKPRERLAALLTIYTVQRRATVCSARKSEFKTTAEGVVWMIPPAHRKTASMRKRQGAVVGVHAIPLPGPAAEVVARAIALAGESEFLFPAERARRTGDPVTHLHPSSLTHFLAKVPNAEASPHDLRRGFATSYKIDADLSDEDVKRVLDHAEGKKSGDVTARHYTFDHELRKKWPVMRGWVAWVERHAGGAAA